MVTRPSPSLGWRWYTPSSGQRSGRADSTIVLGGLTKLSEALSIPDGAKAEALNLCMRSVGVGLGRRWPLDRLEAASLYVACREGGVPTTLNELARASGVRRKEIASSYRLLLDELGVCVPLVEPAGYLPKLVTRSNSNSAVQAEAVEILRRVEMAGVSSGMNPVVLAASALYLASAMQGYGLTQRRVADAAGIRRSALRKGYRRIRMVLGGPEERVTPRRL
jgi:transcription initiation factor TFIIB